MRRLAQCDWLRLLVLAGSASVAPLTLASQDLPPDQSPIATPPASLIPADPPADDVMPQAISPTLGDNAAAAAKSVEEAGANALPSDAPPPPKERDIFSRMRGDDPNAYSIVSAASGLSTHKPMYILPATYSPQYDKTHTEVLFAISAKVQLFSTPAYFAYSQKSFWQLYDGADSRPFRESDYNPELFYRWTPDPKKWDYWGADGGLEHESNGQDSGSRSWNRIYIEPFRAEGDSLFYVKVWYRIPEAKKKSPTDTGGDDNPDIEDYYGYGEIHYHRQIGNRQVIETMVRFNPATGHGALNVNYTIPSKDGSLFYQAYLWQGYGESLGDYNRSVTRIGIGIAFSR